MTHLSCEDCDFIGPFKDGVDHYRATKHQLLWHDHRQDLTKYLGRCRQCGNEMNIYPSSWGIPHRTSCDRCVATTVNRETAREDHGDSR